MDRQEMLRRLDEGENPVDISIRKWEDILEFIESSDVRDDSFFCSIYDVAISSDNCALCEKYINGGCMECPVSLRSGSLGCSDTPFTDVKYAVKHRDIDKLVVAVRDEIGFLKSLRDIDNGGN